MGISMSDFDETLMEAVLAGGLSAGGLGTIHYILRPFNLHPVASYTVGSAACLAAASGFLYHRGNRKGEDMSGLVAGLWVIWGMSGSVVASAWALDWLYSQRRRRMAQLESRRRPTITSLSRHTS